MNSIICDNLLETHSWFSAVTFCTKRLTCAFENRMNDLLGTCLSGTSADPWGWLVEGPFSAGPAVPCDVA